MKTRSLLVLLGTGALSLAACGGGGKGDGSSSGSFRIVQVTNGFGPMLPHRVNKLDAGGVPIPGEVVEITDFETMAANVTAANPIQPVVEWNTAPILASGSAGNHYFAVRFSEPLDVDSVLSSAVSAAVSNNLTNNIQVVSVDPATGEVVPLRGRGFVNGFTYGAVDPMTPSQRLLERWVGVGTGGKPVALTVGGGVPGLGFPGTESDENGQGTLVRPDTFVFVRDTDDDLSTGSHETFPTDLQIQLRITTGVRNANGSRLREAGVASATVGSDVLDPEVLVADPPPQPGLPPSAALPVIVPGDGDVDVDPETEIEITFTEPVQPLSIGNFDDGSNAPLSGTVQIQFGPALARVTVPYTIRPASVFDLTRIILTPAFTFPGSPADPSVSTCGEFSRVDVTILASLVRDLSTSPNLNQTTTSTSFTTGVAPGLVNAPVTPDAIYVGRRDAGISIIDLNGFGQGPGSPVFDPNNSFIEGNTNFPNNPNFALQPNGVVPSLRAGSCTYDGGSRGPFTLAVDSNLQDILVGAPVLDDVGDMALGHALDNTFNNGAPFGCQAGGGDSCAVTGLKKVAIVNNTGGSTLVPSVANSATNQNQAALSFEGSENLVSWAPHPNPPSLVFPPLCAAPLIGANEPTSSTAPGATILGQPPTNFLTPGNFPLGNKALNIPPNSLLATEQNSYFQGPSLPVASVLGGPATCQPFAIRQQIGQFLYVIDRGRREVVVLNSNRFTVLDRIPMADPTSLAMSPNLNLLAVTNNRADQVVFVDTNPASSTFHQIVKTTTVGAGPSGVAWSPDNEDILVCNQQDASLSIISAFTLQLRKTVRNQLTEPIEVVISPRQISLGLSRGIYFAYILNANGTVAVFESGPDGINGIGFDDVVASLPFRFDNPKTITIDPSTLTSSFWVLHENQLDLFSGAATGLGGGAVTRCAQNSGTIGAVPLGSGAFGGPNLRDIQYAITASVGSDVLTGIPVDIAFDNLKNRGGLTNVVNTFSAPPNALYNGKSVAKATGTNAIAMPAQTPQFMFLAVPNSNEPGVGGAGVVDVISLSGLVRQDTNRFRDGVQSIPAAGATIVMDYFRQ